MADSSGQIVGRLRFALLTTASSLALALPAGPTRADESIDGGAAVTVPGGPYGSAWDVDGGLLVGDAGTGSLRIETGGKVSSDYGYIGDSSTGDGTVTVTGSDATWTNGGNLLVGHSGTGNLTIADGGEVSNGVGAIGFDGSAAGTVEVTGSGSTWTNDGNLIVGQFGTGTLTIEAGGAVSNEVGRIGFDGSAVGTVKVTGSGSTWTNGGDLNVGNYGAGNLWIADGGKVSSDAGYIGNSSGSEGTVEVAGAGSTWANSGDLYVGNAGTGTLTIADGGKVSNGTGTIGNSSGGEGTVTVTGAGSTWTNSGGLNVGNFGAGSLTIADGGSVDAASITGNGSLGTLILDGTADARGVLTTGWIAEGAAGNMAVEFDGGILRATADQANFLASFEAGDVMIAAGGAFIDSNGHAIGFATALSGAGGLTKTGAGTLTLSGTNTYVGGTAINGGTLKVGADSALGATSGRLTLGGGTLQWSTAFDLSSSRALTLNAGGGTFDTNGFSTTIAQAISGTGSLTKTGAGTLTLTGTNTYSGGTAITGGTLAVTADANLGDAAGGLSFDGGTLLTTANVTTNRATTLGSNGGTFDTAAGTTLTHGGAITGAGQLTKQGAGTLALTGSNGYEGGTLVLGGELVVDADSLPGDADVSSGAFLTFEQDADGAYTGVISGAGGVRVNGDGTLTFTAVQDYSGETAIAGVLQATTAALAGDVSIAGGGSLILNQDSDGSYAGAVSGAGALVKTGAGSATLTGTHAHTGGTIVNAGTLRVNGTLASLATVGSNGVLGGSGAFLGGVDNRGTLAPGNSIGTMTVTGPLTFDDGAVYEVEVDAAGQSDRIAVDGTATLDGTVRVLPETGDYAQETDYVILTATDAITTTFDAVETSSAFLDPSLSYGANAVTLRLTRNDAAFESVAVTPNQRAVAGALDQAGATGDIATVVGAVSTLSAEAARNAYDQLAGASLAAFPTVQLLGQARFDAAVRANALRADETRDYGLDQMAALGATLAQLGPAVSAPASERGPGAWAAGYGLGGQVDGDSNAAGFDHLGGGVVAGVDWRVTAETTLGVALGYARSDLDHDNGDDGEIGTVRASLYGAWRPAAHDGRLVLDGAFGAGLSDYETKRRIAFAGLDRTAAGETDGHEFAARLGAGYRLDLGAWQMTPQAGLSYIRLHQDGYAETGAGAANLVVDDQTVDSLRGRLGLAAARTFIAAAGTAVTPTASLAWRHEFADDQRAIDAAFAGVQDAAFRVAGADADRDAVELGLGVSATTTGGTTWSLGYGASLSGDEAAHGLVASVRVTW